MGSHSRIEKEIRRRSTSMKTSPLFCPSHFRALKGNLALITPVMEKLEADRTLSKLALSEQPFDRVFLAASPLFRGSRERFLRSGGKFEPKLTTSPRSLSSLILTENRIEYTPHASELYWRLARSSGTKDPELRTLVTYSTSLFHEQNHRLLWRAIAPPRPLTRDSLRRYLNFMESLVVTLDMALGDELGPELSSLGYLSGVLYDPGTPISFVDARARRNYLHLALQATYLVLEGYAKVEIRRALRSIGALTGLPDEAIRHVVDRALRLDEEFIFRTNPEWQKKWEKTLLAMWKRQWKKSDGAHVRYSPSADPLHWTGEYLLAESVFKEWEI